MPGVISTTLHDPYFPFIPGTGMTDMPDVLKVLVLEEEQLFLVVVLV